MPAQRPGVPMRFRSTRFVLLLASAVALWAAAAGTAAASPGALRVMIAEAQCTAEEPAMVLRGQILAQPGVAAADFFDASAATPSVVAMSAYDVVFAMG